jgi:hypothetical protein
MEKTAKTQTAQALEGIQDLIARIEAGITCSYCRKHFHYNIHVPAIVEYEYERGNYSYAFKLELRAT